MKRAERKELDRFIKEKLAISRDTSRIDYTPTDMSEKKQQLLEYFIAQTESIKNSSKRK